MFYILGLENVVVHSLDHVDTARFLITSNMIVFGTLVAGSKAMVGILIAVREEMTDVSSKVVAIGAHLSS